MIRAQGLDAAINFMRAAPTLAQVAVNSAMVSNDYSGEMKELAGRAIHAVVPTSHEYLIPVLLKLVEHNSTAGMMAFWVRPESLSQIGRGAPIGDQVQFVRDIGMKEIEFWVRNFKDIKEEDLVGGEIDYDHIASRVFFAKQRNPLAWIDPARENESLMQVSGSVGTDSTDADVVAAALANVLAAWTRYIVRVVPRRISDNLRTQFA